MIYDEFRILLFLGKILFKPKMWGTNPMFQIWIFLQIEGIAVTSFQENKTLCEQMIDSQLECVTELKYIENRVLW